MLNDIKKLEIGKQQEIQLVIKNAEQAITRNGERYQKLLVRDGNDHEAIFFNFSEAIQGNFPLVVKAKVDTSEFRESACSKLLSYELDKDAKPEDFLPKPQVNVKDTLTLIKKKYAAIRPSLKVIAKNVLNVYYKPFCSYPLNRTGSFARSAGILEATAKLVVLAEQTAAVSNLDKDLMVAGALLYYIGNTQTINNSYNYTSDDVLLGNGISAAMIIQTTVNNIMNGTDEQEKGQIVEEDVKLLIHILTSRYRGIPTAIAEASALRHLDALLNETESIKCAQKENEAGTTIFDKNLYSNRIYCPVN